MSHRLSSYAAIAIGIPLLAGLSLGCESCPDLWYRAFEFDVRGADESHVRMTATEQGTGRLGCEDVALSENCKANAGVYDLTFQLSGVSIGGVDGVCTLGDLTDCAAEDAEARGPWPLIKLELSQGTWTHTIERQGVCP
jgi:hypothetical protein